MRDFHLIVDVLKLYLAKESETKVYDKKVADALDITAVNFATLKRRNSIPYEQIIYFCHKEGLCCSEIFFD